MQEAVTMQAWRWRNSERLEMLSLGAGCPGSWLATESRAISPTLAAAVRKVLGGQTAHSRRDGEAARKAHFLVAGYTFDREARLEAQGGILLVKSDDVGRRCSRGLLVGEVHPSSDISPGGRSTRGGEQQGAGVSAGTQPAGLTCLQPQ